MKAGIMEVPDVFVVNKCDEEALARRSVLELQSALELATGAGRDGSPRVFQTSARTGLGLDALVAYLAEEAGRPVDPAVRMAQETFFLRKAIAEEYGRFGLEQLEVVLADRATPWSYDVAEARCLAATRARIR
jgi:putative protein kinase ArgK-like GTPase of G3E family